MIHESIAAMVVGPFLDDDVIFDIARLKVITVVAVVIAGVVIVFVNSFFFPHLHMIRLTAFRQHLGFVVAL
jgi:hypothetical protein